MQAEKKIQLTVITKEYTDLQVEEEEAEGGVF